MIQFIGALFAVLAILLSPVEEINKFSTKCRTGPFSKSIDEFMPEEDLYEVYITELVGT